MKNKILYFGYGANKTQKMMCWITGKKDLKGKPTIIKGWSLGIQKLSQVPRTKVYCEERLLPLKDLLKKRWGEKFETYVIFPGKGEVRGTLWELTKNERELVKNWERVGQWYKEVEVEVFVNNGKKIKAVSECLGDGQKIAKKVEGLKYKPFLMSQKKFKKIALHARRAYFKRLKKNF